MPEHPGSQALLAGTLQLETWRITDQHGRPESPLPPLTGGFRAQGGTGWGGCPGSPTLLFSPEVLDLAHVFKTFQDSKEAGNTWRGPDPFRSQAAPLRA